MRHVPIVALALLIPGCLAGQLRAPAQDHHVQTQIIVEQCESGTYQCSPELLEDLQAMRDQACLIEAITAKRNGSECSPEEVDSE
jgi:hypothetical protein